MRGKIAGGYYDSVKNDRNHSGGLRIRPLNNWTELGEYTFTSYARVTSVEPFETDMDILGTDDPTPGAPDDGSGNSGGNNGSEPTIEEIDLDKVAAEMRIDGMPSDATATRENREYKMFYVDSVGELFDYLIGLMFNGIKTAMIKIAEGIQGIITDGLDSLSNNNKD